MKQYETQTKTVTEETEKLIECKCDLCGKLVPLKNTSPHICGCYPNGDTCVNWGTGFYTANNQRININVSETVVAMVEGQRYSDGGVNLIMTSIDICNDCFKRKLLPWLEEQGVKPTIKISE